MNETWAKVIGSICTMWVAAMVTVRYFLKGRLVVEREKAKHLRSIEAEKQVWIGECLKSFHDGLGELRAIATEHRVALKEHGSMITDLKARTQRMLDYVPRIIDVMDKVHHHFEKARARSSEVKSVGAESVLVRDKKSESKS